MTIQVDQIITNDKLTLLDPIFTLIVVCSLLLVFIQLKFPLEAKQMLFIGGFIIILSVQLWIVYNLLNDALGLTSSQSTLIRFFSILIIQIALIVTSYIRDKKKAK